MAGKSGKRKIFTPEICADDLIGKMCDNWLVLPRGTLRIFPLSVRRCARAGMWSEALNNLLKLQVLRKYCN